MACCLSFVIIIYRFLFSSFSGRQCRFEPTCSHYVEQSFKHHSIPKALYLSTARLIKCCFLFSRKEHWIFDPVPKNNAQEKTQKTLSSSHKDHN